jgi:hypothetical protein
MPNESTQNIELYHQALQLMEQNSKLRDDMYRNIAERVTLTTRFGLFMLIIIAISIYLLLKTLNSQVVQMLDGVQTMNVSFDSVSANMKRIEHNMANIELQTRHMGKIKSSTESVALSLEDIKYSMTEASLSIHRINQGMRYVDLSMFEVNQNFYPLSSNIYNISRDMFKISEPFENFNSLFP